MQDNISVNKICILHLVVFLIPINILAQSRSFAGLPILSSKKEIQYQSNLNLQPEYERMLSIYDKLVAAKGDRRMPVPQLNLRNEEGYVASMDYRLMDISLEKKAYDVAVKYGDGAIAFLLAHELVHYYEKHGWRSQFADAVSDLETGRVLKSLDDRVANEVQADVLGGFLAYSAGFGIFDKGGLLIDDLYKTYQMGDNLFGYPSKKDRITLSDRNKIQITKLSSMFEMAGLLTVIGKYEEAYSYYGFLLNKYQSRELYNNAGLTCMMSAHSLLHPDSIVFDLPGMMDVQFSGDSRSATSFEQINKLIDEAIIHFETCIIMNKSYLPSYINKASANIVKAINQSDMDLRKIAFSKTTHILDVELEEIKNLHPELDFDSYMDEILILKSILAFFQNDKPTAINIMKKAADLGNEVAAKNLSILKGAPSSMITSGDKIQVNIDGMTAEKFLTAQLVSRNQTKIDSLNTFRVADQKTENFKVLTHDFKGNDQDLGYDIGFVVSKATLSSPFLEGLHLGSDKNEVINLLGKPIRSFSHLNGEILNFDNRLIIITNPEGKVDKVVDFKIILKP